MRHVVLCSEFDDFKKLAGPARATVKLLDAVITTTKDLFTFKSDTEEITFRNQDFYNLHHQVIIPFFKSLEDRGVIPDNSDLKYALETFMTESLANSFDAFRTKFNDLEGGRVEINISLSKDGPIPQISISISDNGPGFIEKDLTVISYQAYTTKDANDPRSLGGFGNHLRLMRETLEQLGGTLNLKNKLDSQGIVIGALVVLTLPVSTKSN